MPLNPSADAVNGVNECFHVIRVGKLRDAVTKIKYVPVCVFVMGKFVKYSRGLAFNPRWFTEQNMRIEIAL